MWESRYYCLVPNDAELNVSECVMENYWATMLTCAE